MELWDLLDGQAHKIGRTMVRGRPIPSGTFHLVVHIWVKNKRGQYLIQKRAKTVQTMVGLWAITGGSVMAGEESLEAAVRETNEELGLATVASQFELVRRLKRRQNFTDIYLLHDKLDVDHLELQKEEVEQVMWASSDKIMKMVREGQFYNYGHEYFRLMFSC
nr:NUDIX domain-containing protein [uncultured Solibaculum sp.]